MRHTARARVVLICEMKNCWKATLISGYMSSGISTRVMMVRRSRRISRSSLSVSRTRRLRRSFELAARESGTTVSDREPEFGARESESTAENAESAPDGKPYCISTFPDPTAAGKNQRRTSTSRPPGGTSCALAGPQASVLQRAAIRPVAAAMSMSAISKPSSP